MVRGSDIIIALIAIIFPPAAVAMMTGCSCDLLISIALTMLVRHRARPCLPPRRVEDHAPAVLVQPALSPSTRWPISSRRARSCIVF